MKQHVTTTRADPGVAVGGGAYVSHIVMTCSVLD